MFQYVGHSFQYYSEGDGIAADRIWGLFALIVNKSFKVSTFGSLTLYFFKSGVTIGWQDGQNATGLRPERASNTG